MAIHAVPESPSGWSVSVLTPAVSVVADRVDTGPAHPPPVTVGNECSHQPPDSVQREPWNHNYWNKQVETWFYTIYHSGVSQPLHLLKPKSCITQMWRMLQSGSNKEVTCLISIVSCTVSHVTCIYLNGMMPCQCFRYILNLECCCILYITHAHHVTLVWMSCDSLWPADSTIMTKQGGVAG